MTLMFLAAALAFAPTVQFTSDSVYKKDTILDFSISERSVEDPEDPEAEPSVVYTLNVKENYALGYCVYNDPGTPYVDGIKVDGEYLPGSWSVEGIDPSADHRILVKTAYSDDIAGWLARAKSGDFSAVFSNPVTVLQFGYYILAGLSLILGGFGLLKAKRSKIKSANEIAAAVSAQSDKLREAAAKGMADVEKGALSLVTDIVTPLVETLSKQNDMLIEATVLARNGDEASTLALLDLLKETGAKGVSDMSEIVKERILESKAKAEQAKRDALDAMKEAVAEISAPAETKDGYDGTSI